MNALIYQLPISLPGTVNTFPNFKYMVCGDNLETITSTGYLNQIDLQSNPVSSTDILQILYNFNPTTQIGTYNAFSVSITNGIITLSDIISEGNVILPVVSGHVAQFSGTNGAIADSNISSSNLLLRNIVQAMGSAPAAIFFVPTNSTEAGGNVTTNSQCGIITTSSLTTAPGDTFTFTVNNPYSQGIINGNINITLLSNGTNTAGNAIFISYAQVSSGVFTISLLNANAGALNGTVRMNFWIAR